MKLKITKIKQPNSILGQGRSRFMLFILFVSKIYQVKKRKKNSHAQFRE